ncbi:alpha/beta hydrolase [Chloroflexota bacterium]
MKRVPLKILTFILISVVIYFGIATVLILIGTPEEPEQIEQNMDFAKLFFDYSGLPDLENFEARDGTDLDYRYYPAQSDKVIILLHRSGWHSQYFLPLAEFISSADLAQVYTPDLRGHGGLPPKRIPLPMLELKIV